MLLYEGYPLATHSSSVVCVDTDLVSLLRASIPSILVEVAASAAFLTVGGEGNNSTFGHCDLLLVMMFVVLMVVLLVSHFLYLSSFCG